MNHKVETHKVGDHKTMEVRISGHRSVHRHLVLVLLVLLFPEEGFSGSSDFPANRPPQTRHNRIWRDLLSRHRREPKPQLGFTTTQDQLENAFKPIFRDCETYKPVVDEESRKGRTTTFDILDRP